MTPATFKVEATHVIPPGQHYEIEKEKAGLTLKAAELMAHKWAKAGYFAFVVDENTGECVGEAAPAEGD
jgi:hypothetical protein